MERHPPRCPLEVLLGPQLFRLARRPVEQQHQRLADAREGVRHVGDAAAGQDSAVGAEGHAAHAAVVGHERRVIMMQGGGVEFSLRRAFFDVPHLDDALEVGRRQEAAAGVEGDVVDVAGVPGQLAHRAAVAHRPELDELVVAAGGQRSAVGRNRQRPHPALVRLQSAHRRRALGLQRPGQHLAVVAGREQQLVLRRDRQGAHPALVTRQHRLLAVGQVPADDGVVLGPREDELPGRIDAAAQQRARMLQLLHQVYLGGVHGDGGGRGHASTSRMAEALGSAMGMGR